MSEANANEGQAPNHGSGDCRRRGIAALTGTTGIASAPPLDPRYVRTANLIRLCRTVFQPKNAGRMGASGHAVPPAAVGSRYTAAVQGTRTSRRRLNGRSAAPTEQGAAIAAATTGA